MKAIVSPCGTEFVRLVEDDSVTRPSVTREFRDDSPVVPDHNPWSEFVEDVWDVGPELVVHTCAVRRRKTPLPRTWTALEFDVRVETTSPGAWERLEAAAANPQIPEEYRLLLRAAIRQAAKAQEIVSDDPRTLAFLDAAVSFGVISEDARSRILFE